MCRVFLFTSDDVPESEEHILKNREGTVKFTSRWMLHQLKLHLNSHIEHKCMHKKFGTVLYRKGGISHKFVLGFGGRMLSDDIILTKAGYIIVHSELSTQFHRKHPENKKILILMMKLENLNLLEMVFLRVNHKNG